MFVTLRIHPNYARDICVVRTAWVFLELRPNCEIICPFVDRKLPPLYKQWHNPGHAASSIRDVRFEQPQSSRLFSRILASDSLRLGNDFEYKVRINAICHVDECHILVIIIFRLIVRIRVLWDMRRAQSLICREVTGLQPIIVSL